MHDDIVIREYRSTDCAAIAALFYDTVHTVCAGDYTEEQLSAWAPEDIDIGRWDEQFLAHRTLVAECGGKIAGFGDMTEEGYLDRLYVSRKHLKTGIATLICNEFENSFEGLMTVHASITARPFFEKRGYFLVREQAVERRGAVLTNFVMCKTVSKMRDKADI